MSEKSNVLYFQFKQYRGPSLKTILPCWVVRSLRPFPSARKDGNQKVGRPEESGLREAINKRTLSLPMIRGRGEGEGLSCVSLEERATSGKSRHSYVQVALKFTYVILTLAAHTLKLE